MNYKILNKDLVLYQGQDTSFQIQPIEEDGWKPNPSDLDIVGFVFRPMDDIGEYHEPIQIDGSVGTIVYDPSRRFDYSYSYNLFVSTEDGPKLFQYGNVIIKNEHRVPD